jgi:AMP-binding enzyme/Phosphopantetheine attachment site/AMP-binding enzyme C-terminal domain
VRTLPRPVQGELPTWLTSAGSPETFERAGRLGVNVLTHLLGQSVEQLARNVERYRAAWRDAGHPGEGRVTLMMHTYLHIDGDTAREIAREPMKAYLGTAVGLLRDVASAFPTFAGRGTGTDDLFASLSPDELDQLLEVAAQRYLGSSGLFGTVDDAVAIVDDVSAAGIDEVACLVDFGVPADDVLASLELVLEAKRVVEERRRDIDARPVVETSSPEIDPRSDTVAALVARHGVTHLQCTPSLCAMLLADPADRSALTRVHHLLLGGEALPVALADEVRRILPARFTNMYGPTETTIWSLVHEVETPPTAPVPIGRPIANTTVFVLDAHGHRVPLGAYGELHIGGEGVARGYHQRAELTAERFVERPGMGRVYATGDLARIDPAGHVDFAGRADNQVKIRGHRIELGEIEDTLDRHDDVVQSVVVARGSAGDQRLVGFVRMRPGAAATPDGLRSHLAAVLPEVMVPSAIVVLDAMPLTPNGKIDRVALPVDVDLTGAAPRAVTPPADDTEGLIAEIWAAELDRPVGRDDNFFEIGGHSLLAVKVFRRICDATSASLSLTDVFRFPTVRTFAAHLGTLGPDGHAAAPSGEPAPVGADRGAMRRRALGRRGADVRGGRP